MQTHQVSKPTRNLLDMVQSVLSRVRLCIRTPDELICYRVAAEYDACESDFKELSSGRISCVC